MKVAMVKIAARLMIMVATVMPERNGFLITLSDASLVSAQDSPGMPAAQRWNCLTAKVMNSGLKDATPSKNTNMPTMPKLNCRTAPETDGAKKTSAGETTRHKKPSRVAHDLLP